MFVAYFRVTNWTRKKDEVRSRCVAKEKATKLVTAIVKN